MTSKEGEARGSVRSFLIENPPEEGKPRDPHTQAGGLVDLLAPLNEPLKEFEDAMMAVPAEDDHTLIFPWNEQGRQFSTEHYDRVRNFQFVTEAEINKVFAALKESSYYDLYGTVHYWLGVGMVALLGTIGLVYYLYSDSFTLGSAIVYFILSSLLFFGLAVSASVYWNQAMRKRLVDRERDFTRILEQANQETFRARGVEWICGHFGTFVEIDYSRSAAMGSSN